MSEPAVLLLVALLVAVVVVLLLVAAGAGCDGTGGLMPSGVSSRAPPFCPGAPALLLLPLAAAVVVVAAAGAVVGTCEAGTSPSSAIRDM